MVLARFVVDRRVRAAAGTPTATSGSAGSGGCRAAADRAADRMRRAEVAHRRLVTAAALLVGAGLVVAGATGWDWWSRVREIRANQAALTARLDAAWAVPAALPGGATVTGAATGTNSAAAGVRTPAAEGAPVARLYLPRLDLDLVVVEGVTDADLLRGPGHITGTPLFNEPGNTGIAGHRYPGVFWDLDQLRTGDPIAVETADKWFVYRVFGAAIVEPDDARVLRSRPEGAPAGTDRFLTLVTCDPRFTTAHRLVRQAALARVVPRGAAPPPEVARSASDR
jgi:sortase A